MSQDQRMYSYLESDDPVKRSHAAEYFRLKAELPSAFEMAANATKAAVEYLMSGGKPAPPELVTARLDVCRTCPQLMHGEGPESAWRCGSIPESQGCGCYLTKKAAVLVFDCPAGKWPKDSPPAAE